MEIVAQQNNWLENTKYLFLTAGTRGWPSIYLPTQCVATTMDLIQRTCVLTIPS
jgi:hypothetical protein